MIRYALKCGDGHEFFSWFQSAQAFDVLQTRGNLSCPDCGIGAVDKAVMAPRLSSGSHDGPAAEHTPLTAPETPGQAFLARLRREVETKSDYVGRDFAVEARAMHDGDRPRRSIWGEARPEEARQLVDDGIPITPLPFIPKARTN